MHWKTFAALFSVIFLFACQTFQQRAAAMSPLPFFAGVERLVLFCGRPVQQDQREALCKAAHDVLQELSGGEVALGTVGLSDPAAITVLINGYPLDGPNGPVLAVDIELLRNGRSNDQLFGSPPLLFPVNGLTTNLDQIAEGLGPALSARVVVPWLRASPERQAPKDEKGLSR